MKKKILKILCYLLTFTLVLGMSVVSVDAATKKKTVKLVAKPKIVSVSSTSYDPVYDNKVSVKVSWAKYKSTVKLEVTDAKKKVLRKLYSKKVTKSGSSTVSWDGKVNNKFVGYNSNVYFKFTQGKKYVYKSISIIKNPASIRNNFSKKFSYNGFVFSFPTDFTGYDLTYKSLPCINATNANMTIQLGFTNFNQAKLKCKFNKTDVQKRIEILIKENTKDYKFNSVAEITIAGNSALRYDYEINKMPVKIYLIKKTNIDNYTLLAVANMATQSVDEYNKTVTAIETAVVG